MSRCFRHNLCKFIPYRTIDKTNLFRSLNYSLCAESAALKEELDHEDNEFESIEIEDLAVEYENEKEELETIDDEWEPEQRYQDFLKFYCSHNALDRKKWTDIAAKLDTGPGTLQTWVHRITNNNDSDTNNLGIQFAELTDVNGEIQKEAQILLCRPNLSIDLYWPSSAVPALHSLILIDNTYIACIMKHLSITHLRALIIAQINENANYDTKYIVNKFPLLDWRPIHENTGTHIINAETIMNSQNIIALGYRFKIPLLTNCIMSSCGQQIIYNDDETVTYCDDLSDVKIMQSNGCNKQSYYNNYKKKQKLLQETDHDTDTECDDNIILYKVFPTGIKYIDLLNPCTKHGINIIISPKGSENNIFKQIGRNWLKTDANHMIYVDIFDDDMDAINMRNEVSGEGKLTLIAGNKRDCDWFKLQTAITAATLSKNDENACNTLVIYPHCNILNKSINNLQRDVCGGLSKLKFENDDEIGHKAYDWIKRRNKRNKPQSTTEFYLNYGIEPVLNGSTYIIGLEMNYEEIRDIRINPNAYFPFSDTVIICDENNDIDIAHSSSNILSEIKYTDLSMENVKVLNGLRRLYCDSQLLSKIDNNDNNECVLLWNKIFNDDENENDKYENTLTSMYKMLMDKYDNNGDLLLDVNCLQNETANDTLDNSINNPLISILERNDNEAGNGNDDLLEKLNKLYAQNMSKNIDEDNNPQIFIRSKFDHGGFLKSTRMNISIELFSDIRYKYGIGIGQHCALFINGKAVKLPQKYGYQKKKKKENEDGEEEESDHDIDHEILNVFEQLSAKFDGEEEFGVNIVRYEKGKIGQRYDFFVIAGELTQDIYEICIFIFGYNGETKQPFMIHKRVGPDALPVAAKNKKRKKKTGVLQLNGAFGDEHDLNESHENIINIMERKEFVFTDNN